MTQTDRRRYERIDSVNMINYTQLDAAMQRSGQGMGRTLNLSEAGMLIETPTPIIPDHQLSINIGLAGELVFFRGKVAFTQSQRHGQHYTGVRFTRSEKSGFNAFCAFLNEQKKHQCQTGGLLNAAPGRASRPFIEGPPVDYLHVVDEESFERGQAIVEQGRYGNWIWVILDGTADVVRYTPSGKYNIARLGPGAFIGSVSALVSRNHSRQASVIARESVLLGVVDTQRLISEYDRMSPEFRKVLWGLNDRFQRITERALQARMGQLSNRNFILDGIPLIPHAQHSTGLYVLADGQASVMGHRNCDHLPLINLYKGDIFGNLPFVNLGQEPERATVVGNSTVKKIPLRLDPLQTEFEKLSATFRNLLVNIADGIAQTTESIHTIVEPQTAN
ncbi:MAG: cyclic nucleotide-binding domain-containing protein [Desulfosarcinaceae bacterium]|nr:cyclic nucleotide-binding domain-containing protein [Desulfosarcinaceae bacterium]